MGFGRDDIKPCHFCGEGMGAKGVHFYRVKIEQMVLDLRAIQREHGLEQMMGGNVAIAQALSPEAEFAQSMSENEVLICADCAINPQYPALMVEDK
ncbi:MAG: hypothetical protein VX874_15710 [Pseudomonadota bacterium]|nr:hypothetical protein [Pseudomonadota bacterium]